MFDNNDDDDSYDPFRPLPRGIDAKLPFDPLRILALVDQEEACEAEMARAYGPDAAGWPLAEIAKQNRRSTRISAMMHANVARLVSLGILAPGSGDAGPAPPWPVDPIW